ncbi:hypothetical protein AgCh_022855 [Apium graveolens]
MPSNKVTPFIPKKGTNYITFTDANQAPDSFKSFVKFLSETYFPGALTSNPVLYLDILSDFWNTAVVRTVVHENQAIFLVVNCSIQRQGVEFHESDVNKALEIPTDNLVEVPTQEELDEFMDFINYSERINLASLKKKNLRKEWSFLYDFIVRAFTCRKTGYDNISSGVSIEKSTLPCAPCKESAPALGHIQVYERRNKDDTHTDSTSLEAPSSIQGELPTLSSEISNLISKISSSYNETLEYDSQVLLKSSDMVQETMITTQEPHLVGERLHSGVDLDDINTNTRVSSVFTEDPVVLLKHLHMLKKSSQIDRGGKSSTFKCHLFARRASFEVMVHDSNLVKSPPIQLEVPIIGEQHTVTITVPTVSQTVASVTYKDFRLSVDEVLARFREEYITILGSNAKALGPQEVYDVVTKVYKAQLKAFHLMSKALQQTLDNHQNKIRRLVKDKLDDLVPTQVEIKNKFQIFTDQMASNNDTRVKLDQLHQARYKPSALLMKGIKESVQSTFDSHKHLQMRNLVYLGAIMGVMNVPFHALPEAVRPEIPNSLLLPANKTKGEIETRIKQSKEAGKSSQSKEAGKSTTHSGQSSIQLKLSQDVSKDRIQKAATALGLTQHTQRSSTQEELETGPYQDSNIS